MGPVVQTKCVFGGGGIYLVSLKTCIHTNATKRAQKGQKTENMGEGRKQNLNKLNCCVAFAIGGDGVGVYCKSFLAKSNICQDIQFG